MLKAFDYIEGVAKSDFFRNRPISFLTCGTRPELPSHAMVDTVVRGRGREGKSKAVAKSEVFSLETHKARHIPPPPPLYSSRGGKQTIEETTVLL